MKSSEDLILPNPPRTSMRLERLPLPVASVCPRAIFPLRHLAFYSSPLRAVSRPKTRVTTCYQDINGIYVRKAVLIPDRRYGPCPYLLASPGALPEFGIPETVCRLPPTFHIYYNALSHWENHRAGLVILPGIQV
jgi:hypothetical protein